SIKPDIAIEFRQQYNGPGMRKFGNMFRAFDCPNDPVTNRIRTSDVKLLCGETAVHSDPQTWNPAEKVELAAFEVLNGFFGVPQMSVHLRNIPEDHLKMIRFYTRYWKEHADILMDGHFSPINPLANYPILKAEKNGHAIVGVYEEVIASFNGEKRVDLLNATLAKHLVLRNTGESGAYHLTTWDCQGNVQLNEQREFPAGLIDLEVPASGMVRIERLR
ncbi:MAG: alpha-galactosidase, partial [Bacteroidota bacterium]